MHLQFARTCANCDERITPYVIGAVPPLHCPWTVRTEEEEGQEGASYLIMSRMRLDFSTSAQVDIGSRFCCDY